MINPFAEVNWKPGRPELRKFGRDLLVVGGVLVAILWAVSRFSASLRPHLDIWLIALSAVCCAGLGALALPSVFRPVYFIWYGVSCAIGLVISNLILAAVFYLVFTPMGLLRQRFGGDPLQLKSRNARSMFHPHPGPPEARRYYRQY
jgi:hypothetical protein